MTVNNLFLIVKFLNYISTPTSYISEIWMEKFKFKFI